MPCPHFKISIRKRSERQSAVAGAAYQSGENLFSEYDLKTKNYHYKAQEVLHKEILLPAHAPPAYRDRQTLWNAAEKIEKQWNAQLARGVIMALPRELPKDQYASLVRDYCMEQFVSKGMCADFAIHDKGDGNPHAHIMLTMRAMDEDGRWLPKSRKVYALDENGEKIRLPSGEPKSRKEDTVDWNNKANAELWRTAWAAAVNRYFEINGISERLDLRSYERQGIDKVPTVHLGPSVAHMEAKGIRTEIGDYNRAIKAHNAAVGKLKKLISSLESWLAETKEKLSLLFVREEKKPTLISLLNDYAGIRKGERREWSSSGQQKGAVLDLKFISSAFAWMQSVGIATLEDFENLVAAQKPLLDKISGNDKQLRKLNRSVEHIENFNRHSPVYAQSQKGFSKAKEKYTAEHQTEQEAFSKAVRYMKANRLVAADLNECREQRDALRAENKKLKSELAALNLDPKMLRSIQHCVDTVLNHVGEIPHDKPSTLARLTAEKKAVQTDRNQPPRKRPEQER